MNERKLLLLECAFWTMMGISWCFLYLRDAISAPFQSTFEASLTVAQKLKDMLPVEEPEAKETN